MTDSIVHRGPDDEGFLLLPVDQQPPIAAGGLHTPACAYTSPYAFAPKKQIEQTEGSPLIAALGHRRLSIVDLSSAGHQPMCLPDKTLWVSYNGEIFNYPELRAELELLGHRFDTQSDTEVLLHAYRQWGIQALHKFNGFFAFILCDLKEGKAFAVRDRFGVKPLYFWESPDGLLAFASEIKEFTFLPGWRARLNGQQAYDYLNWGLLDASRETLFTGVKQLRGGEYLEFPLPLSPGALPLPKKWYRLERKPFEGSFDEAAREFYRLLEDSIRLRLRADVDVGTCLSGGLDSSSIVCLSSRLLKGRNGKGRQKTFSACAKFTKEDESFYIDLVASSAGVEPYYTYPNMDSLFETLETLIWHQDEPFVSTSMFAQWIVYSLVQENQVKVMLNGQGADEQLAGYHGFFGNLFYDLLRSNNWRRLAQEIYGSRRVVGANMQPVRQMAGKLLPEGLRQPIRRMLGKSSTNQPWLDMDRLGAVDRDPFLEDYRKDLHRQSLAQLLKTSLPSLLHYEDRNSMAHSVESRTPFLDYRLAEFCLGLPAEYKISDGWTKKILRQSMRGVIPDQVRLRTDKMAFGTGEEAWVKKQSPARFMRALNDSIESSFGILKPEAREYAQKIIKGSVPYSHQFWRMICFGFWMKRFKVLLEEN